jgi:hypothetical protein
VENGNIQSLAPGASCTSGSGAPSWSTTAGGTTVDNTCTWTMKAANPAVYTNCSPLPCFEYNKYFFLSPAQSSNTNWAWGGATGLVAKTWAQWQAAGQDSNDTMITTGAKCAPQVSAGFLH